jgi:3-phosphoshikimate 1-carboxyvinyltransferase
MSTRGVVALEAAQPAALTPPISKSDAQRALVLAKAIGMPELSPLEDTDEDLPGDVRVLRDGLALLSSSSTHAGAPRVIDCHDGGAPFRILVGQAAVMQGVRARFIGSPRLGERPHGPLLRALEDTLGPHGLEIDRGDPWPLDVRAADGSGVARFVVSTTESSQFATSLLLAAATLCVREQRPWGVELTGEAASMGYLGLTLDWLRRFGFSVRQEPGVVEVEGYKRPTGAVPIPGDWSSIGYLLLAAWRTGGSVKRAALTAAHPDRAMVEHLRSIGLRVEERGPDELTVTGEAVRGLEADGHDHPDLLLTLGALACVLPGPSTLHGVSILAHKESDRRAALLELCRAAGAEAQLVDEETIEIDPGIVPAELAVSCRSDHRVAMSAATLAVLSGARVALDDVECVRKSFPGFWRELRRAGVTLHPA